MDRTAAIGRAPRSEGVRIAAVGDSLTVSNANVPGWVRRACDDLDLELVCEAAENGARARRIRTEFLPRALASSPDICVVLAGANDVGQGRVPFVELARIWLGVRRSGSRLILATLPPHERGPRTRAAQNATNLVIRTTARATGWSLVGLTGPLGGRHWLPELRKDHGHPNPAGKARMAQLLTPALLREVRAAASGRHPGRSS